MWICIVGLTCGSLALSCRLRCLQPIVGRGMLNLFMYTSPSGLRCLRPSMGRGTLDLFMYTSPPMSRHPSRESWQSYKKYDCHGRVKYHWPLYILALQGQDILVESLEVLQEKFL